MGRTSRNAALPNVGTITDRTSDAYDARVLGFKWCAAAIHRTAHSPTVTFPPRGSVQAPSCSSTSTRAR